MTEYEPGPETDEAPVAPVTPTPDPADVSLLGAIRARRDERVAEQSLTLAIPTWGGELAARYGVVDAQVAAEVFARASDSAGVDRSTDFMISACRGVLLRDGEGALAEVSHDGQPVTFSATLAEKLGLEEFESARALVAYLFGHNGLAIIHQSDVLASWMRDTSLVVDDALLGESRPAATSRT